MRKNCTVRERTLLRLFSLSSCSLNRKRALDTSLPTRRKTPWNAPLMTDPLLTRKKLHQVPSNFQQMSAKTEFSGQNRQLSRLSLNTNKKRKKKEQSLCFSQNNSFVFSFPLHYIRRAAVTFAERTDRQSGWCTVVR